MSPPRYWTDKTAKAAALRTVLAPMAGLYGLGGRLRQSMAKAYRADAHTICVGSAASGGSGKTPVAQRLAQLCEARGHNPALLARGYGGALKGPVQVDPERHDAAEVGDEALLHAKRAPTWVARRRDGAAREAEAAGHDPLILDDGLTHPHLFTARRLLVMDAREDPFSERVLPAGPLREPFARTLEKLDAALVMGEAGPAMTQRLQNRLGEDRVFHGRLVTQGQPPFQPLLLFTGVGRPNKVYEGLLALGADIVSTHFFADHYVYSEKDMRGIAKRAEALSAQLITTEKDSVRLPKGWRNRVHVVSAHAEIEEADRLLDVLMEPRG